jgi:hypothetical protein
MSPSYSNVTYDSGLPGGNKDINEGPQSGRVFFMPLVAKYVLLTTYFIFIIDNYRN